VRRLLRPFCLTLLIAVAATPVGARNLVDELPDVAKLTGLEGGSAFDALGSAIADATARNLPILSASAGFTYRYDADAEVFVRSSDTLGPIFLERPDTLGRNKFNVNVSFQYVQLDEFDGTGTNQLKANDPLVARTVDASGALIGFTANELRYSFKLINNITAFSFTYGVLDDLDVNLLVPLISTDFDVTATRTVVATAGPDGVFSPTLPRTTVGKLHGNHFGLGDIFLRGKYLLPRCGWLRSAVGLWLRLPSGDEDQLQGSGTFEASPYVYLSTLFWGRVEPHANFGIDLRADDVSNSQGIYDLGVDVDITKRINVAIGFLGRSEFGGSAESGETNFLHLTSNGVVEQPLLGIDFGRKDYYNFSFGGRAVVWRQIMLFANGIYALNDAGLRSSEIIPTVGLEGTF
jgi:Putative MetA-pathway of phenol degradation